MSHSRRGDRQQVTGEVAQLGGRRRRERVPGASGRAHSTLGPLAFPGQVSKGGCRPGGMRAPRWSTNGVGVEGTYAGTRPKDRILIAK